MLLVSGSIRSVGRLSQAWPNHLGHLLTPTNRNSVESVLSTGISWAIDNGAFSGFDPESFRRLLSRVNGQPRLLWIVCPDSVGNAEETERLFDQWRPTVASAGPVAFVGQDGCEDREIPWSLMQCLFIGGSAEWKMSNAAWDLAQEAKRLGKWVHLGRVNSRRRLRYAWSMNADSTDGSSASMFGDKYIHKYLRWQSEFLVRA